MARLINADYLKGCKILKPYKGESVDNVFIREIELDEIPTAYDVDNVAMELQRLRQRNKERAEKAKDIQDRNSYLLASTNFATAIEIVRKGD